jgi:iron complex transport system substrate-binding protein
MASSWFSDRFRRTAQFVAAVAVVGLLAGCGANAAAAPGAGATPTAAPAVDPHPVEPGAYPAYVKHEWGVTKIENEPKRIVALGFRDQEDFLAMGIKPLTIRNFFGAADPWIKEPWLSDEARNGQYQVYIADVRDPKNGRITPGNDGPILPSEYPQASNTPAWKEVYNLDEIKNLHPDLITALYSGLTQDDYLKLSAIAPTVTGVSADLRDYFSSWQEEMNAVGAIMGRPTYATQLVNDTEAKFTQAVSDHPEFRDASIAVAAPGPSGQFRLINPYAPMSRFFSSLRMDAPGRIDTITSPRGKAFYRALYNVDLPTSELSILNNIDVLVFIVGRDGQAAMDRLKATSAYQSLSAVRKNHILILGPDLAEALYYASPMSIPWALDKIVPQLAGMLGDKAAADKAAEDAAARDAANQGDLTIDYDPSAKPDDSDSTDDSTDSSTDGEIGGGTAPQEIQAPNGGATTAPSSSPTSLPSTTATPTP